MPAFPPATPFELTEDLEPGRPLAGAELHDAAAVIVATQGPTLWSVPAEHDGETPNQASSSGARGCS